MKPYDYGQWTIVHGAKWGNKRFTGHLTKEQVLEKTKEFFPFQVYSWAYYTDGTWDFDAATKEQIRLGRKNLKIPLTLEEQ